MQKYFGSFSQNKIKFIFIDEEQSLFFVRATVDALTKYLEVKPETLMLDKRGNAQ